jgi:hypothetical protein
LITDDKDMMPMGGNPITRTLPLAARVLAGNA